ncbi:MAG TPA: hypothetical protein VGM23_01350 [Armatimonadota bacterium]|jgi:hypothetical protein
MTMQYTTFRFKGILAALVVLLSLVCHAGGALPSDAVLKRATVINPLEIGRGINAPQPYHAENIDTTTMNEFIAFERAFSTSGDLRLFAIPKDDPPTNYRYTGVGPFPIKAMHRYALAMQAARHISPADPFTTLFCATYLQNGKSIRFDNLYGSREDQVNMPRVEQDFPTPPGADSMILWIGVSNSPNRLQAGSKLLFKSLQLIDRGAMKGTDASRPFQGVNLLPVSDFETLPLGPYAPGNQIFYFAQGNQCEIAQAASKCLHIVHALKGYPFPYFSSQRANLDNCGVEFSFRIKGKGTIHPMIWWMLKESGWSYYGGPNVALTDDWQSVHFWRGCVSPDADYVGCSFAVVSPEADFYVDDVDLRIVNAR